MIVTTGKIIRVEILGRYTFETTSEAPGGCVLTELPRYDREGGRCNLPGNLAEAQEFCAAYLRCVAEEVGYRRQECENLDPIDDFVAEILRMLTEGAK